MLFTYCVCFLWLLRQMAPDLVLTQPRLLSSPFCGVESPAGVSLGWDQGVCRLRSFAESGGGSVSLLLPVVGRLQVLARVGLRSLFSCWLSAGSCSRLPEAAHILGLWTPPSVVKSSNAPSSAFHASFSFLLISLIPEHKGSPISGMPVIRLAHPDSPEQYPAQDPY